MEATVIVIINIVFTIIHLVIKNKLERARVIRKKTVNALNILLFVMLASFVALYYLIMHNPVKDSFFNPSAATVFVKTTEYLLYSSFFWVSAVHHMGKILLYTMVNKKARVYGEIGYYRDDLSNVHPGILSLLYNFKAGESSDITAVLLKLKLEGFIKEIDDSLTVTNKDTADLLHSEKLIYSAVKSKYFNPEVYISAVKAEAKANKLISGDSVTPDKKRLKILINVLIPFVIFVSLGIAASYMSSFAEHPLYDTNTLYVRVSEDVYNQHLSTLSNLSGITLTLGRNSDRYYVRADVLGGIHELIGNRYTLRIAQICVTILSISMVLITIPLVSSQIQYSKYDFKRTAAGYKLINNAIGLKNYLKDFSIVSQREAKELHLWEYYMIYAVVLEVNVTIEDKVVTAFANKLKRT